MSLVCTIWHDKLNGFIPVRKNCVLGFNNEWFRVNDASWDSNKGEWIVILDDENVLPPASLQVSIDECVPMFNCDWFRHCGEWFEHKDTNIPQCDGTFDDGNNAGETIRRYLKHLSINEPIIEQEKEYIDEYGIDNEGYIKHARFDENGFAMEAS